MRRITLAAIVWSAIAAGSVLAAQVGAPAPAPAVKVRLAANPPAAAASAYTDVLIKDVPHIKQKPDFCGEACAAMALQRLGKKWDQDDVFNVSGVDPVLARGCTTRELAPALTRIGFKVGPIAYKVPAAKPGEAVEAQWAAMHADLARGVPSIVCTHYDETPRTTEHFRLILGYAGKTDEVIYHEPAAAEGAYLRMKRDAFLRLWPLKYEKDTWTLIRMRLEPGEIKDAQRPAGFTQADFAQHIMGLRKKIPSEGTWGVVVATPFVVVGDQSAAIVKQYAQGTVRWSTDMLKADFFTKDPAEILDVWLFKDKPSYERYTREVFHDTPTTPYGYYSSEHQALIMNIATGGGTLVHEIVHPFMRANFAECPDWFNEGMGSLYEQSESKAGHIRGRTNWRLAGLKEAIAAGRVPTFEGLLSTTSHQFYNLDRGTNYAQARYLCYYLQERGLLVKYYHEFADQCKDDPTGYKTLQKVLNEKDMTAFQKRWEAWVTKLTFP